MLEEIVLSKKELVKLFEEGILKDKEKNWLYEDKEVKIVALHKVEPKFLQDLTNAEYFKIVFIK
ncbi:hypothetical protein [Arcobacter porcinus]|uniref:hypothetical protein n=1 Tax=Arcobacter porcinus TaxID=1935204 RepID=UPI00081E7436|nr:hypothetical protein [Arcobacter porcinus]OCL82760.1 hypothetical protein AAW29_01148 [Arcobacter porcinus]OCL85582.1 hypothetical protein AAX30_01780 [Arcobacter porcinus]